MTIFDHPEYKHHERIVFHHDPKTGLKAIIAIHDRRLGPAIGGCRMLPYESDAAALTDVLRLSRGMTYKCALGRIPFGGGKAVIIGDPGIEKTEPLLHAMADLVDSLNGDYITSFDSGTTLDDVRTMATRTAHVAGVAEGFQNASASTARGVLVSIRAAVRYRLEAESLSGIRVAIQGLGNVGLRLARLLKQAGAELYASDTDTTRLRQACEEIGMIEVASDEIYGLDVDVFSPCALGAIINQDSLSELKARIICGGANNQLSTPGMGDQLRQRAILYAPDYIVNGGGIIELHYQINGGSREMLASHLDGIGETLMETFARSDREDRATSEVADQMAEELLAAG